MYLLMKIRVILKVVSVDILPESVQNGQATDIAMISEVLAVYVILLPNSNCGPATHRLSRQSSRRKVLVIKERSLQKLPNFRSTAVHLSIKDKLFTL